MGRKPNRIEVNRSALIWLTDHGSEKAVWGRGVCWGCDSMTDQSRQIWLCNDIKFTCPSEEIVLEATITLSFNSFSRKDRHKKHSAHDKKVSISIRNTWNVDFVGVVPVSMKFTGRFENDVVAPNCEGNSTKAAFAPDFEVIVRELTSLYTTNFSQLSSLQILHTMSSVFLFTSTLVGHKRIHESSSTSVIWFLWGFADKAYHFSHTYQTITELYLLERVWLFPFIHMVCEISNGLSFSAFESRRSRDDVRSECLCFMLTSCLAHSARCVFLFFSVCRT